MRLHNDDLQMICKLMFRLLPVQVLLAMASAVNSIVSSYFATNYVGMEAMSAVGLYSPIWMLLGAIANLIAGGCAILCGKSLGANDSKKLQQVFSLDLALAFLAAAVFTVLTLCISLFHLSGMFTADVSLWPAFERYVAGMAIGIIPYFLYNQFPVYLTSENKGNMTILASIVYIIVNLVLNILFVKVLHMEEFGLALSSAIGMWIFMAVEAYHFFTKDAHLKIAFDVIPWKQGTEVFRIGFPGAASYIYQTLRGLILNRLLESFCAAGSLSAFALANNVMSIFWALPAGMANVSRLMFSVSHGEEDRQGLVGTMKVMFRYFIPLMCIVDAAIIVSSPVITSLFVKDIASPAFAMTVSGLRILPLCMPLSIILMHFTAYGQVSGKSVFVNIASILDGVVCVAGFSMLLVHPLQINGIYIANVLNSVVTTLFVVLYAMFKLKRMPRNTEDLMVIPDSFGVTKDERIDISVKSMEEVIEVSKRVQDFCLEKGIDSKRAYLAGLCMEEMAGNIVEHGFVKDKKKHSIDIRVAHKNDKIILRIKDDCIPFDPKERNKLENGDDLTKNIGIRMIYQIMKDIDYQNMLGINVLTISV
ncbi:MAG: ATP-binding protein [Erysipelotrichaceae bacterium]|nr:ATP-binding protein [Erysipelotrichaceae bacterium]